MSRPPSLLSADAYARHLARERALSIATRVTYFPLRAHLLKALGAGDVTISDLITLGDHELLERAGASLELLGEPGEP